VHCNKPDYTFSEYGGCCGELQCLDIVVEGKRVAVCSQTASPDPRCAERSGFVCADERTRLRCRHGHAEFEEQCAAACVERDGIGAFCALSTSEDPRCAGFDDRFLTLRCEGDVLFQCDHGFVVSRDPCTRFPSCVEPEPGQASCAVSSSAQPECAAKEGDMWCDGADVLTCRSGLLLGEQCAPNAPCTESRLPNGEILSAWCDDPSLGCALP
jgi:hypothetical protein